LGGGSVVYFIILKKIFMKFPSYIRYHWFILTSVFLGLVSCDKTVEEPVRMAYLPAQLDERAGQWTPYVFDLAELKVPAPEAATSAAYQREISELKSLTASLSGTQQQAVDYWGAGAIHRWNEIARDLAAQYNLAPVANPNGQYPVPDPANPTAEPRYPFANPPYTARMLAYLSVAQYDALVATWKAKFAYGRKAPAQNDPSVKALLPQSALPAYPSEDAVVAQASFEILKVMFPGEVAFLEAKMKEHKNSRLWAGMNVPSDIAAGEAIGTAVATKVLSRGRGDGMSASNNQALTAGMIQAAMGRGIQQPWVSQEIPARPPMLPNYGSVATWNFDRSTLVSIRPAMPYVVGSAQWQQELSELEKIQKNQTREQARIANYWADGAGSYTPPGHWHRTAANLCHDNRLSEVATARTMALLGTALMDAGVACWETKFYYYTPRPQQFGLKTSVGLPNFPAYTSGHSTFSAAAAAVLGYVFPSQKSSLETLAKEASESRIYGLIHFRADCEMGLVHGKKIGELAIQRSQKVDMGIQ
jgi:membrane-associated phospholipid phosphatase